MHKPGLWPGFGLICRSASQNLCGCQVTTRHTATYWANWQGAESVTPHFTAAHTVLSSLHHFSAPIPLCWTRCPFWSQQGVAAHLYQCAPWLGSVVGADRQAWLTTGHHVKSVAVWTAAVVVSAVLAGWLRKVQKNLLCGGTGVFLLPLLQPFST